jgi:hypothetical protein
MLLLATSKALPTLIHLSLPRSIKAPAEHIRNRVFIPKVLVVACKSTLD